MNYEHFLIFYTCTYFSVVLLYLYKCVFIFYQSPLMAGTKQFKQLTLPNYLI